MTRATPKQLASLAKARAALATKRAERRRVLIAAWAQIEDEISRLKPLFSHPRETSMHLYLEHLR